MKVLNKFLVVATAGLISVSAFAADAARSEAKQVIELKDGATLYLFKDGKMAMENKFGQAVRMKEGAEMETKDGQKFKMTSDEVARLSSLLNKGHGN